MTFELLHETFAIVVYFLPVKVQVILPLLLMSGQYLQVLVLQKLKPRGWFVGALGVVAILVGIKDVIEVDGLVVIILVSDLKKSVMDL